MDRFGSKSWELDALDPSVLVSMVRDKVHEYRDPDLWQEKEDQLHEEIETLNTIIDGLS